MLSGVKICAGGGSAQHNYLLFLWLQVAVFFIGAVLFRIVKSKAVCAALHQLPCPWAAS